MLQPSEEIKSRLDIVEVIREYINLKPAGVNFRALCPFHNEKSPSFIVSPEKQIWHCFGCGKGGDIFTFVMEIEGVNFPEALRMLAPKAGVELKRQDPGLTSKRNQLLDILEISRKYYQRALEDSKEAESARAYLAGRGMDEKTLAEWKIGYSPDSWDDLLIYLKSKGFSESEIFASGMAVRKEETNRFYNRFRGRIMFPINDVSGNAVAFSSRVLPENEEKEKMGKYVNSPQTAIYDKSKILFGLDKAKLEIKQNNSAVIVEGQMDAITAHKEGFKNVVASSGTALTRDQVNLLKRYSPNISLAFDMDEAGAMAVVRGAREALQAEMNVSVVEIPEGKDPDECIRKSKEEWKRSVEKAKPLLGYYFDKVFGKLDLDKSEHRREAARQILPVIALVSNKIDQSFWLKRLSEKIDVSESILNETLQKAAAPKKYTPQSPAGEPKTEAPGLTWEEKLSELLAALLLKFPLNISYAVDNIQVDYLKGQHPISIYRNLAIYYNERGEEFLLSGAEADGNSLYKDFRQWAGAAMEAGRWGAATAEDGFKKAFDYIDRLALLGERDFYDFNNDQARIEIVKIVFELKRNYLLSRLRELEKLISEMEGRVGGSPKEEVEDILNDFKLLSEELRDLKI